MTNLEKNQVVEDAMLEVPYERYGLSSRFVSVRYVDLKDDGSWKIAFWLKGSIGKELLIPVSQTATEETLKREIISAIESSLPAWRKALME